jgi:hypothetical protein
MGDEEEKIIKISVLKRNYFFSPIELRRNVISKKTRLSE